MSKDITDENEVQEFNDSPDLSTGKKYTEIDLLNAIKEVQENKSTVYGAAKKFKIPVRTLGYRVSGKSTSQVGKSSFLSEEIEKELADWISRCARVGDPRTKTELFKAASELALLSQDERKHFKNNVPTSGWLKCFMKRNPQLSFRTPSTVSKAAANVSRSDIIGFFNKFVTFLEENEFMEVFKDPKQVGNGDESGFELNSVHSKVIAASGSKTVYRRATANPKEQVSVMYNFLASGHVLPPQLILKKAVNPVSVAYSAGSKSFFFVF